MKGLKKIVAHLLLLINIACIGILLLSAYSPHINPEKHPILACFGMGFPIMLVANCCFLVFWLFFSHKFILIPIIGILLCAPQIRTYTPFNIRTQQKNIPENSIKLLSYNIMGFNTFKKDKGTNPILEYIKNNNADIVCLQEYAVSKNKKYLTQDNVDNILKMYPYQSVQKVGSKKEGDFIACFSKYPILSSRVIDYKSGFNGSVVYEIKIGEDTLTVINNHLESNKLTLEDKQVYEGMIKSPEVEKVKSGAIQLIKKLGEAQALRAPQARTVAEEIKKTPHPYTIVCGDFNDNPISYTHRVISENLDDAFVKSGNGIGVSYNRNKFYFRIDNILTSKNLKTYNCIVDRSIKESDHYPMWCYISKK